jgi:hypothetical protein
VPLPPSLNPEGDTRFTKPPPARRVLVRTHTRAAPTRKPAKQKPARPVETVRPASHLQDIPTPPVGSPPAARRHWEKVTGRKLPPEGKVRKPGPVGDEKSQLNAAQLAAAQRAGVRPTVAMKALEQTVHPLTDLSQQALGVKPFNVGGAVSDVANIASNFVPVGKAAGIFAGLRGIKGLKAAKEGAAVVESAKAVEPVAEHAAALRGAISGRPVERVVERPRTPEQAEARLAQLERQHNAALDKIAAGKFGPIEQREVNERTWSNKRAARQAKSRGGASAWKSKARPTVKNERRAQAEQLVEDAIAKNPEHPIAVAWRARTAEIDQLREALNPMIGEKIAPGELGTVTSRLTIGGKSVRQLQKEQKQLYSQERGRRAAAAQVHLSNQALAPDERIRLAKHELKGELPKIKFQGFTELSTRQSRRCRSTSLTTRP